jgi:hypothetical protein
VGADCLLDDEEKLSLEGAVVAGRAFAESL